MELTKQVLEDFKKITNKDLTPYITKVIDFLQTDYFLIIDYSLGKLQTLNSSSLERLKLLIQETKQILELFSSHKNMMKNYKFWLLLDEIEGIDNRLLTLTKINKWVKSSKINIGFSPNIQISTALGQKQTFEQIAKNILGSTQPEDDWSQIPLQNNIIEEDYTSEGGTKFSLKLPTEFTANSINSVVDVIEGKSIYGKDLHRNLTIDEDEEDLLALDYDDTLNQSIDILIKLKKNDNPDSPDSGLQSSLVIGSNRASLNFPVIIRQLQETFATDDTIANFNITSISLDQDNTSLSYELQTRLNELVSADVLI